MDKTFLVNLRKTLEILDKRLGAVEHLVNNVIIDGMKQAAEEYDDNEKYSIFVDNYKSDYEPYCESAKVLFGDDYDLSDAIYESLKEEEGYGTEGFDEKAKVLSYLSEIQAKIDALTNSIKKDSGEKSQDELIADFINSY